MSRHTLEKTWPHYNQLLLLELQRERIEVVLVSPRNPLNIGAAARAMANFGFARLSVVAPFAPTWREARSAIGAPELLENAKEFPTLSEAVADCTLVIGTGSLTYRKPEQQVLQLPHLPPLVGRELGRGGRVALVFGPEKHGLTGEDLSFCHLFVEIPTDFRQPSMNLGQAVAVCLYELATRGFAAETGVLNNASGQATEVKGRECDLLEVQHAGLEAAIDFSGLAHETKVPACQKKVEAETGLSRLAVRSGSLDLLAGLVEQVMRSVGYSPRSMQAANRRNLRLLLRRIALSETDARRILGLFRRILWRLNHATKAG